VLDFDVVIQAARRNLLPLLVFALFATAFTTASAQRCSGFVSVDGALLGEEAAWETACYFGPAEGAEAAYVRTDLLTAALGLESEYLVDTGELRFVKGDRQVELATSSEPAEALRTTQGALRVDGQPQPGRRAVLAGSSYLPLAELVRAFGGGLGWNGAASLVVVDFSTPVPAPPPVPSSAAPTAEPPGAEPLGAEPTSGGRAARVLGEPRYAVHSEGYTRVAVDVPAGVTFELAVEGDNFIVLFEAARAEPYALTPDGPQLTSLGYAEVGGDALALIASTTYALDPSGRGFTVGRLPAEGGGETLYIDFSPEHRGERVAALSELPRRELAAVQRPADVRKTVVIDPGHGGHDPGAVSDYVVEKELVLSVGLKLRELLEARGIAVQMTRDDDTYVELEDRASFAVPSEHNLFVSLHANSTETAGAEGIETWVFGEPQDDSLIELAVLENGGGDLGRERTEQAQAEAASIDGDLLREENLAYSTVLAQRVQHDLVGSTGSANRGVRKNYFLVIREARVPAVLVELGFINHPTEGPKLADPDYQEQLARSLADGIEAFLRHGGSLAALETPSN
jgi:N-acetylmuramoyl-L-alanine amidase